MTDTIQVNAAALEAAILAALTRAGADEVSAAAATRAMMHASRLGIDSHGVRLATHYARVLQTGRVNPRPNIEVRRTGPSTAVLDADDGLGHRAAYAAMDLAAEIAREAGAGVVGVVRSSHYGAAGAYALAGAEAGLVALSCTNADAVVALHGGAERFHGTNPIAAAAPVPGQRPWLLDMATSSIPLNRVFLYRTLGLALPDGVAADKVGASTRDPAAAAMLLPLGGTDFGFKGAGLAGLVTILCAVLTGTTLDHEMIPMTGSEDLATPRNMGHFCLAIDPAHFAGRQMYEAAMMRYLAALRGSMTRAGEQVMAPGDREWAIEEERLRDGIPVDRETLEFLALV